MKRFNQFCDTFALASPFPVSESTLCYFAVFLANDNLSSQTIKTYLAAVRDAQIALGMPEPRCHASLPRLDRIQAGIRRVQAQKGTLPKTRLPITPMLLRRLRDHWGRGESGHNEVLWAIASICFFRFFRLGELLSPGGRLKWADISFDHPSKPTMMKIHLSTSKCDQFGRGADVFIGQTTNALCPIAACLAFLRVRGTEPGPFFVTGDGSPVRKEKFIAEVRKVLAQTGLCPEQYAGHSFRIGAAPRQPQLRVSRTRQVKHLGVGTVQHSSRISVHQLASWLRCPRPLPSFREPHWHMYNAGPQVHAMHLIYGGYTCR